MGGWVDCNMINRVGILLIFIANIYSQGMSGIDSLSIISDSWFQDLPRAIYADLKRVTVSNKWFWVFIIDDN